MTVDISRQDIKVSQVAVEIGKLPLKKDIKQRKEKDFNFAKKADNIEAALAYIAGDIAVTSCSKYSRGSGPFVLYIVLNSFFDRACSNCRYNREGSAYSLYRIYLCFFL